MRRALWIGAAAAVAVAAAIPLWLVLDDGGVRRLGSIDAATTGQAGRLILAGVNGGAPIPIDSVAFRLRRPVGATSPEIDSIEVALPLGASMPALVARAVQATKAETGRVELIRSMAGTPTVYLAFELTGATVEGLDDHYTTQAVGAQGMERIALRYTAMTMTCIPAACAASTHTPGTQTEILSPDLGAKPVLLESGNFAVPKDFKSASAVPVTVTMPLNDLLPALLARANDGKPLAKTTQIDLVKIVQNDPRKIATYKLGGTVVTSLTISATPSEETLVQFELSSRRFGVTAYTYLDNGAPDKPVTFCWDLEKAVSSCTGL